MANGLGPNVASSWHCWPPVGNGMYPFSQSWAMCGNDGTVWITANNMRADCWWEECGPDQSGDMWPKSGYDLAAYYVTHDKQDA